MHTRSGFSLMELVVAVFLLALILTAVGGLVASTVQSIDETRGILRGGRAGPVILDTLTQELAAVHIYNLKPGYFIGKHDGTDDEAKDSISFVTSLNSRTARLKKTGEPTDLCEITYWAEDSEDGEGLTLYRREDPVLDDEPDKGGRYLPLASNVVSFRVRYLKINPVDLPMSFEDLLDDSENNEWNADDEEGALPTAVVIELVMVLAERDVDGEERPFKDLPRRTYRAVVRLPNLVVSPWKEPAAAPTPGDGSPTPSPGPSASPSPSESP
jgi:prepilin-type N-terminal cleavage/methylation domain-containing protein